MYLCKDIEMDHCSACIISSFITRMVMF